MRLNRKSADQDPDRLQDELKRARTRLGSLEMEISELRRLAAVEGSEQWLRGQLADAQDDRDSALALARQRQELVEDLQLTVEAPIRKLVAADTHAADNCEHARDLAAARRQLAALQAVQDRLMADNAGHYAWRQQQCVARSRF